MDKLVDAIYKKTLILLAIAGGIWVYGFKFYEKGYFFISGVFMFLFIIVTLSILNNLSKIGFYIKKLEEIEYA